MFAKTLKNSLYIFTAFILISCGGGGDTSILKLSLGLRNLLDEEYYASMASSVIYDQYKLGTSVSLGVKFSF
tara:strand:- start:70 stop:285 length:216 start_codon:yes stop_codon:yes gene_type:complete